MVFRCINKIYFRYGHVNYFFNVLIAFPIQLRIPMYVHWCRCQIENVIGEAPPWNCSLSFIAYCIIRYKMFLNKRNSVCTLLLCGMSSSRLTIYHYRNTYVIINIFATPHTKLRRLQYNNNTDRRMWRGSETTRTV